MNKGVGFIVGTVQGFDGQKHRNCKDEFQYRTYESVDSRISVSMH